jgi:hypothetical protein
VIFLFPFLDQSNVLEGIFDNALNDGNTSANPTAKTRSNVGMQTNNQSSESLGTGNFSI